MRDWLEETGAEMQEGDQRGAAAGGWGASESTGP